MKAISLWQPWATLIALGVKQYETRDWTTHYRGLLAIHAAKRPVVWREIEGNIEAALIRKGEKYNHLPLGAVLCIVRLVDIVPVEDVVKLAESDWRIKNEELDFGNYQPDRYAWKLEMVKVSPEPVPVKGAQGLWEWHYK